VDMAVAGTYRHVGMLPSEPFFGSGFGLPLVVVDHADVSSVQVHQSQTSFPSSSLTPLSPSQHQQPTSPTGSGAFKRLSRPMDLLRWFSTYVTLCARNISFFEWLLCSYCFYTSLCFYLILIDWLGTIGKYWWKRSLRMDQPHHEPSMPTCVCFTVCFRVTG